MAKDIIHNPIRNALIKDGWTITHDPYTIEYNQELVYADLAAERVIAAERGKEKIVVEIKSFTGRSVIKDFRDAFGQYMMYLRLLAKVAPEYKLYLAISNKSYLTILRRQIIQLIMQEDKIPLIVVSINGEVIVEWIN